MTNIRINVRRLSAFLTLFTLCASAVFAQQEQVLEEIVVTGKKRAFANQLTTEAMKDQQNPITSVLATIDNLPGVNITEGDTFGFDDWSTTINVRGYQISLSDQQIGVTIDGLPNGESNYGGGSKANRFIDSANLSGVDVSQGTADVGSRSLEALGGTLNFITRNPLDDSRMSVSASFGDFDSKRYAVSYDTGTIFNGTTRSFVSLSHQEATDWVNNAAENERDHAAFKFISELGRTTLTGYLSLDEIQEDNYQRITLNEFIENPDSDRLTADWTGVPYVDQLYRRGWSTLRDNYFGYLKLDSQLNDNLRVQGSVYRHDNEGRGDWVPPQIVDVIDDGAGPQSETLGGQTAFGSPILGAVYFVDAQGIALSPREGCVSSITFPYGGAGPEYDPACYSADAIAVQSYRHTHYKKERTGLTADFSYDHQLGVYDNQVRGGLWYEDQTREEYRDWHRILDTRVGFEFDPDPYYVQYDREYPREVANYYLQDNLTIGSVTLSLGIRQFFIDLERIDNFDAANRSDLNSDSDVLFAGGFTWATPVEGLDVFAGYAENFKALNDLVLERDAIDNSNIEPETSDNFEVGIRYESSQFSGNLAYFSNTFENRLEFFSAQQAGNIPNYTIGTDGRYDNVGGIETDGFEISGTVFFNENLSLYGAYTYIDAIYVGTGLGAEADQALGIFPGNKVANTAESSVVTSLDWNNGTYRAGLSAKYVDDRFIDRVNASVADSYTTADLYMGLSMGELVDSMQGLDLSVVVNNVFDESYLGGISGFGAWIGAPRTTVFTVSANF